MKYNKQTSKRDKNQRESNIPTKKQSFSNLNKVNNRVFVFTKSLTVGELAKELNVNASDIIKKLFLQKKLVTINNYLDDETIGEICLEFGYDFKKQKIVNYKQKIVFMIHFKVNIFIIKTFLFFILEYYISRTYIILNFAEAASLCHN